MKNIRLLEPQENVIYRINFNVQRADEFIYTGEILRSGTGNPRYKFLNVRYGTFTSMTPKRFTYGIRWKLAKNGIEKIDPKNNPLYVNQELLRRQNAQEERRRAEKIVKQNTEYDKERRIIEWLRGICPAYFDVIKACIGRLPGEVADDFELGAFGKACTREEASKSEKAIQDYIKIRELKFC